MSKYSDILDLRTAADLAQLFGALSDPTRLRLISVLTLGEQNVGALAAAVGLSESAVSHQLRLLRSLRLVRSRRDGRQIFYCLDDEHIADLYRRGLDHVQHT
jgi:DNA-binding transcriptional ArsR family regulator